MLSLICEKLSLVGNQERKRSGTKKKSPIIMGLFGKCGAAGPDSVWSGDRDPGKGLLFS